MQELDLVPTQPRVQHLPSDFRHCCRAKKEWLKRFERPYKDAKARIWPWLAYLFQNLALTGLSIPAFGIDWCMCSKPVSSRAPGVQELDLVPARPRVQHLRSEEGTSLKVSRTFTLSIRCILDDIRLWLGDPATASCLVYLSQHTHAYIFIFLHKYDIWRTRG